MAGRRRTGGTKPRGTKSVPRSVSRTVRHAEAQNAQYVGPWFVLTVAPVFGMILHGLASGATVVVPVMVLVVTVAVGVAGWHDTASRSTVARAHVLVTVGLSGAWLALCSVTGFVIGFAPLGGPSGLPVVPVFARPTLDLWAVVGCALVVAWNMRQAGHVADARAAEAAVYAAEVPDDWSEAGHPGVTGTIRRVNEWRSEGVLTIPKDDTLESLQRDASRVETAHGWPRASASMTAATEWSNSRKVWIRVMHADPLAQSVVWPGMKLKRGQTVFDPIPVVRKADGDPGTIRIATPDGGQHCLVMGMTGAGKTVGEKPVLLYAAALRTDIILIDTVKRTQSFGAMADVMQMFEIDPARARAVIQRLLRYTLPARTEHLAREGLTEWDPKRSELNFLKLHIEEAWSLCDEDALVDLSLALRSAGGQLTVSLQRAAYDQMSTTLRGQLSMRRCYGLMEDSDAGFALKDGLLDVAAVNPSDWGTDKPGIQYIQQNGVPLAEQATPVRSYDDRGAAETFAQAAQRIGAKLHPMCPVTAASLGVLWTERTRPSDLVRRTGPVTAGPVAGQVLVTLAEQTPTSPPGPDTGDGDYLEGELLMSISEDGRTVTFEGADIPSETMTIDEPDPDPTNQPNPDDEIEAQPTDREPIRFGRSVVKCTQTEFDAHMERRLAELLAEGREIRAADFATVVLETGWSRATVYNRLADWVDQSRLVRTDEGLLPVRVGSGV